MKENCAECKHHDVFWGGSGCNLLNNKEHCKFERETTSGGIKMRPETKRNIEESYKHIKPYIKDDGCATELRKMCQFCENYYGDEHDYNDCINMPCFQFWLAYEYLEWLNSSDGY